MREKGLRDFNSAIGHAEARGEERGIAIGEERGKAEGKAEGELKKAREIALKLLSRGMSIDEIADITDLTEDEIRKLMH
jgi:predicted transposase/invertase (TIGR01784 family)